MLCQDIGAIEIDRLAGIGGDVRNSDAIIRADGRLDGLSGWRRTNFSIRAKRPRFAGAAAGHGQGQSKRKHDSSLVG